MGSLTAVWEITLGVDRVVDPLLFSPEVLTAMYQAMPGLAGFGHLGLYEAIANTTAAVEGQAGSDAGIGQLQLLLPDALRSGAGEMLAGVWKPPETLDDLVLGILFLALDVHLLSGFTLP